LRITRIRGNSHATQDGCKRRIHRGSHIGMPAGPGTHQALTIKAVGLAITADGVDFGMAWHIAKDRVTNRQLAKLPAECNMLFMAQVLIAKEDDFPLEQCSPNTRNLR